jgi:acyl dehydratase
MMRRFAHLANLAAMVGQELAVSDAVLIDQDRIDGFAAHTEDRQWIHVDHARAAAGPFGTTVAHGYLTLAMLPHLLHNAIAIDDVRMGVNYGLNRVRFPAPVPSGSRIHARFKLLSFEPIAGGAQLVIEATLERDGGDKPVAVIESVVRQYT